jgi:hypothetical protein
MNISDHSSESSETIFSLKILKFYDADPDPGSIRPWIRDENIQFRDPEETSWIRNTGKMHQNCVEGRNIGRKDLWIFPYIYIFFLDNTMQKVKILQNW